MFGKLGWKTLVGAVLYVIGSAGGPEVVGVLTEQVSSGLSTAGAGLAAVGLRHAISKLP